MKTIRKVSVKLNIVDEFLPATEDMKEGIIYHSKEYMGASHLCLCGCKMKVYTPVTKGEWSLIEDRDGVTMKPSLAHRIGCRSHYIITNGIANFV